MLYTETICRDLVMDFGGLLLQCLVSTRTWSKSCDNDKTSLLCDERLLYCQQAWPLLASSHLHSVYGCRNCSVKARNLEFQDLQVV